MAVAGVRDGVAGVRDGGGGWEVLLPRTQSSK